MCAESDRSVVTLVGAKETDTKHCKRQRTSKV